jgi:thiamine kinase
MLAWLEQALARWVPGEGALRLSPLAGGWVNSSYLIERDGRRFSLRLARTESERLGVDRVWECAVRQAAGAARLAPRVLRCDGVGLILSEWANGRVWTRRDAGEPAQLARLASLLRRVHCLAVSATPREMTPESWCQYYEPQLAMKAACAWAAQAQRQIERHTHMPALRALCHSDLHHLNVIDDGALMLLDWEYAHCGDPFWDLAAWIDNHDLDAHCARCLLQEYLGRPATATEGERLQCLMWLFDYVCWLWCELAIERRHGDAAVRLDMVRRRDVLAARLTQDS